MESSTGLKLSSILEEDRSLLITDNNNKDVREDNDNNSNNNNNPLKEALEAINNLAEDEEFNDDEYKSVLTFITIVIKWKAYPIVL